MQFLRNSSTFEHRLGVCGHSLRGSGPDFRAGGLRSGYRIARWDGGGMMSRLKYAIPLFVFVAGLITTATLSFGKAEYTKKEKKGCVYCHTKALPKDSKDLNDVGKCYEKKKTLDGCAAEKK